ncbi:hypothetical protein M758_N014900 [Ceratodon purpureus]|nr:hypothetical protein M758_N014900 [Ceratodon purpureus]
MKTCYDSLKARHTRYTKDNRQSEKTSTVPNYLVMVGGANRPQLSTTGDQNEKRSPFLQGTELPAPLRNRKQSMRPRPHDCHRRGQKQPPHAAPMQRIMEREPTKTTLAKEQVHATTSATLGAQKKMLRRRRKRGFKINCLP